MQFVRYPRFSPVFPVVSAFVVNVLLNKVPVDELGFVEAIPTLNVKVVKPTT